MSMSVDLIWTRWLEALPVEVEVAVHTVLCEVAGPSEDRVGSFLDGRKRNDVVIASDLRELGNAEGVRSSTFRDWNDDVEVVVGLVNLLHVVLDGGRREVSDVHLLEVVEHVTSHRTRSSTWYIISRLSRHPPSASSSGTRRRRPWFVPPEHVVAAARNTNSPMAWGSATVLTSSSYSAESVFMAAFSPARHSRRPHNTRVAKPHSELAKELGAHQLDQLLWSIAKRLVIPFDVLDLPSQPLPSNRHHRAAPNTRRTQRTLVTIVASVRPSPQGSNVTHHQLNLGVIGTQVRRRTSTRWCPVPARHTATESRTVTPRCRTPTGGPTTCRTHGRRSTCGLLDRATFAVASRRVVEVRAWLSVSAADVMRR